MENSIKKLHLVAEIFININMEILNTGIQIHRAVEG